MTLEEYTRLAQMTSNTKTPAEKVQNAVLGLSGEAGELADLYKKATFQGHAWDPEHAISEAGDVFWYLAELAEGLGVTLETFCIKNIEKLRKRYPDGHFDPERSLHRAAGDR